MRDFPIIQLSQKEYFFLSPEDFKKLYYDIEVQLVPDDGSFCYPHLGQCSSHANMRCDCHGENWGNREKILPYL